jgi:hypothetical protein
MAKRKNIWGFKPRHRKHMATWTTTLRSTLFWEKQRFMGPRNAINCVA